jgi:hypothetical protein
LRTEWLDKRVEPSKLYAPVKDFFNERGLTIEETFSEKKYCIAAFLPHFGSMPFVVVEIHGDLHTLVVDFLPWGRKERKVHNMLLSWILAPFGGGILVRQDLRKEELMEKVENQFWDFMNKRVLELAS